MNGIDIALAIKQPEYDNLVLEINQYVDKINCILKEIEMIVYNTQDYFQGEVGDAMREKFGVYSKQTDTVIKNLLSYGSDLLALKQILKDNDESLVSQFSDYITGLNKQAENVIENKED